MHEMWLACDVHSLAHVVQTLFSTPEASTDVLCMRHTHTHTHSLLQYLTPQPNQDIAHMHIARHTQLAIITRDMLTRTHTDTPCNLYAHDTRLTGSRGCKMVCDGQSSTHGCSFIGDKTPPPTANFDPCPVIVVAVAAGRGLGFSENLSSGPSTSISLRISLALRLYDSWRWRGRLPAPTSQNSRGNEG